MGSVDVAEYWQFVETPGKQAIAAPGKQAIPAETAGHAWILVLERHVSLLAGIKRALAAILQGRDATASTFPNTYMHHGFRAMNGEELAKIMTLK